MGRNFGSLTKSKFRRDFNAVEGSRDLTAGVARSARRPGTADTQLDRRGCAWERDSFDREADRVAVEMAARSN